ncbi:hypothetical protein F4859DRAFT_166443 [Xylaria cf. heliscus]|nr:hypothetical protein F4859DRAFT_166443 [Xylaria cf. heliscus]
MESSPLIKAHDHARAASAATHTSDTTVAINEHARAAGEFASAAKETTSVEALRTLKLLEEHHRRLSELLHAPLRSPSSQAAAESEAQGDEKEAVHSASDAATGPAKPLNEKNAPSKPTLLKQPKYPARDLGASIASNLASARGIRSKYRSQPLSPSVSNTEVPGNLEGVLKKAAPRSKMQDMLDNSDKTSAISSPDRPAGLAEDSSSRGISHTSTTSSDEGFSRFYSAFGSIINRISAPLAFAGLPLISEEQPEEQIPPPPPPPELPIQKRIRVRHSASTSTEPDIQKLYSKAALRAVAREGQSTNDSFYVVPTSGHTASYASILTFADKEKRRMEASTHATLANLPEDPDEDDFVDARESQITHSPALKRRAGRGSTDNIVEELYLENKSLKDMIDILSKRLHAFESMSQNSGMRLAESMRLMRPGSPLSSAGKPGTSEEAIAREISELKQQNQVLMKQNEELEKSYTKARANLVRYREKWDQLKAGAKARRAGSAQGNSEIADDAMRSPNLA